MRREDYKEKPQSTISALGSSQIGLHENLTAYRKSLFRAAKNEKEFLKFKFLWTSQGQIRLRRDSVSKAINISSFVDLSKLGYSGPNLKGPKFA